MRTYWPSRIMLVPDALSRYPEGIQLSLDPAIGTIYIVGSRSHSQSNGG